VGGGICRLPLALPKDEYFLIGRPQAALWATDSDRCSRNEFGSTLKPILLAVGGVVVVGACLFRKGVRKDLSSALRRKD
jgi:hypothetical protein